MFAWECCLYVTLVKTITLFWLSWWWELTLIFLPKEKKYIHKVTYEVTTNEQK